jgi:hypothetical protein
VIRQALVAVLSAALFGGNAEAATLAVTSTADEGEGSLRAAITAANASPGSVIEVVLGPDAQISISRALPPLDARGIRFEGGGVTLRESTGCVRPPSRAGCDGIVVTGPGITVRDVRVTGFTFDGVAVRGRRARDVRIERVQAVDNLDDGVGVSAGAGPVLIEGALLMGNGFRTKGKGLLVFDEAEAQMTDSIVLANRDGVTVTRGARARLERVVIAGNFDKGLGVSAARASGRFLEIVANGRRGTGAAAPPNGDGVRVGLGARLELDESRIAGNADAGVVVLDTSSATLRSCVLEGDGDRRARVSARGRFVER